MRCGLWVPVIVPPGKTLSPASPSLQRVPRVSVPRLLGFSCSQPSVLCSAKTTVAPSRVASHARSRPDTLCPRVRFRPSGRVPAVRGSRSALGPACSPACLTGVFTRRSRSSRVPRLPLCVHAPLSDPGGVPSTRLCVSGTRCLPAQPNRRLSRLSPVILLDHNYKFFGALSRGLHARYTWLHTYPCGLCMQVRYRVGGSPPLTGIARLPVLTRWVPLTNFTASAPLPRSWTYSTQNCSL